MKKVAIALLCALALAVLATCDLFRHDVEYRVTGTAATVSLTYENSSGGTSQTTGTALPWTWSFSAKPGDFLYVSAQNEGASGNVTAEILVNGTVDKSSTSSGAYVIATADEML